SGSVRARIGEHDPRTAHRDGAAENQGREESLLHVGFPPALSACFANAYAAQTNAGCTSRRDEKFLAEAAYSLRAYVQIELATRSVRLKLFRNVFMGPQAWSSQTSPTTFSCAASAAATCAPLKRSTTGTAASSTLLRCARSATQTMLKMSYRRRSSGSGSAPVSSTAAGAPSSRG